MKIVTLGSGKTRFTSPPWHRKSPVDLGYIPMFQPSLPHKVAVMIIKWKRTMQNAILGPNQGEVKHFLKKLNFKLYWEWLLMVELGMCMSVLQCIRNLFQSSHNCCQKGLKKLALNLWGYGSVMEELSFSPCHLQLKRTGNKWYGRLLPEPLESC